ncbi:MAG: ketoacyl-ACP synthase III [Hespellia sp.]|nr:ketoacyl-ACP synthase III [Hespellia sp.]
MIGRICGTGSYAPPKRLTNDDLARFIDTSDEWIQERTGVVTRHVIEEDTTVTMAAKAAKSALEDAGMDPQELDLILVSTLSSNVIVPCAACEVQKEIGAVNATCFDLNAACTGFLVAYNTAQAYISSGMYQKVLIIGSESLSTVLDWTDRGTCILFGDGAGAAVLSSEEGILHPMVTHSDGTKGGALKCSSRHVKNWEAAEAAGDTHLFMDGQGVFRFAVKKEPEAIRELLEKVDMTVDEIDYFILHQANKRIIESVAKRLKCDIAKFPMNIQEYGNTSSASIGILLDELNKSGVLKKGQKIILAGFGAGLSWGATLIEW